ncbi:MAG: response regulator [Thermodesulfobacteriota bacterium]
MNKVLIVDKALEHLKLMESRLDGANVKFEVLTASSGEDAVKILKKHSIATLVTGLYLSKMSGLDLLDYMSQQHSKTPCVVISQHGDPEIRAMLGHRGIFAFFEKPCDLEMLSDAVNDALFHFEQAGGVDGLSISGFLQLMEMEDKSCTLEVSHPPNEVGKFYCVEGQLHDAEFGDLRGEEAAHTMIGCWENVSLRLKSLPSKHIERRINVTLQALILDSARRKDEVCLPSEDSAEKVKTSCPDDQLRQAIKKAESGDCMLAHKMLIALLQNNTQNFQGWIWFSRVAGTIKAVKAALHNASILAPEDAEIQERQKQLAKALEAGCPEVGPIEHCPFCWTSVSKRSAICPWCHGMLTISKEKLLSTTGETINRDMLDKGFHRYVKVTLLDRSNVKAHYNLALACLSLGKYDDALEHLYTVRKLAPKNKFYNEQLAILLDYLASMESSTSIGGEEKIAGKRQGGTGGQSKRIILVVEDSATTRKVITLMLEEQDFEVVQAKNGIDALAKFNEITPDLVLLDIIMPGMDGYEVLSTIKKNEILKDIPVIMLTAKDSLMDKIKGKMSASNEYLTKPFTSEELMVKINKYLPTTGF